MRTNHRRLIVAGALALACGIKGAPRPPAPVEPPPEPPPPSSPIPDPRESTECAEADAGCPQVQPPVPVPETPEQQ